jgi:hypothetical protein
MQVDGMMEGDPETCMRTELEQHYKVLPTRTNRGTNRGGCRRVRAGAGPVPLPPLPTQTNRTMGPFQHPLTAQRGLPTHTNRTMAASASG